MNRIIRNYFFSMVVLFLIAALPVLTLHGADTQKKKAEPAPEPSRALIDIDRMTCGSCAYRVRSALLELDGVADAQINVGLKAGTVFFYPDKIAPDKIADTITGLGYPAKVYKVITPSKPETEKKQDADSVSKVPAPAKEKQKETPAVAKQPGKEKSNKPSAEKKDAAVVKGVFKIERMTCYSCVNRIRQALYPVEGVFGVDIDLPEATGEIIFDPAIITAEKIAAIITDLGYPAKLAESVKLNDFKKPEAAKPAAVPQTTGSGGSCGCGCSGGNPGSSVLRSRARPGYPESQQ